MLARLSMLLPVMIAAPPVDVATTTQAFHVERLAQLEKPEGWLSLVGLLWLKPGANRVGASPDNDLQTPKGSQPGGVAEPWPDHIGRFTPAPDGLDFQPDPGPGGRWSVDGVPFEGGHLKVDPDGESPRFAQGARRFSVIRRGDRIGLRLRDRDVAKARAAGLQIPTYQTSPAWRIEGRFEPAPKGATLPVLNVLGMTSAEPTPGSVTFEAGSPPETLRLAALRDDDGSLFFVFGDRTNGDTTYGAGRFLSAAPAQDGRVVLDFNQAIDPPCAFTPFATCPVPPKGNRLPIRVEAGEKKVGHP